MRKLLVKNSRGLDCLAPAPLREVRTGFTVLAAALLALAGCNKDKTGPIVVSAIGSAPSLAKSNAGTLDPPSEILAEATAQGLVRFEASGQIEPALAQRWIVSDDGLRYTFRLAKANWTGGPRVTAAEIVVRLHAADSASSRNRLKPMLGMIQETDAMIDDVLEIALKHPSPYFLELLAQPDLALIRNGQGSGPYRASSRPDGSLMLRPIAEDEEDESTTPKVILRGERASLAIVRFREGAADFVTGGSAGDLPLVRLASLPATNLRFDPVGGLFGFAFASREGPLAQADFRQALSMVIDRPAMLAALGVPDLLPRASLVPAGLDELTSPALPPWAAQAIADRRITAARVIAAALRGKPLTLRVAIPDAPGYRQLVSLLQRDLIALGIDVRPVALGTPAELRLIDEVAPAMMASWYLRSFSCEKSPLCDPKADEMMETARNTLSPQTRAQALAAADQQLEQDAFFIPIAAPVRWSLISPRLNGFRPNAFGRHALDELIAGNGAGGSGESGY